VKNRVFELHDAMGNFFLQNIQFQAPSLQDDTVWTARSVYLSEVGSCHHGMAGPQVAGGGTASNMEGSCEYIE
jgi:hypothetical protein